MFSRPPLLPLVLFAGWFLARPAGAQQPAPPAVDPAAVLATLKDLRSKQTAVVSHERTNVLAAIGAAMADPGKAYEQALAAVEVGAVAPPDPPAGPRRNINDPGRALEIRRRQSDLLRDRDFIAGLRLQLLYLSLSFQRQSGTKLADLLNPLLDYTAQAALAADSVPLFEPLHKSIGNCTFAAYFQLTPFLAGLIGWEDQPFNVEGIYEKTILPEMRVEKDPRLLQYWDNRIQTEGARADASHNGLLINKFKTIRLPSFLWSRAEDEIVLNRQNQAIPDMLALIKAHPDHPDFQKWADELEKIVSPPAAAPAPAAAP